MNWTNPHGIDLAQPFVYLIRISADRKEYRYIGKGSSKSRLNAYRRNVERVLAGEPSRPLVKRDGEPQSLGNVRYRYVHLVLAVAVRENWKIEHYPLENCAVERLDEIERLRIAEYDCNMNAGRSWFVEDFDRLAAEIR